MQPSKTPDIIFAVDDLPENLQMLKLALRNAPFDLYTASSGEEALEWLAHHVPDLILMDIQMPGLDGYDTTQRIKADPRLVHVPVLFISGISDQSAILKCFEAGAVDYVSKPFKRQELVARITVHLQIKHLQQSLEEERNKISGILANILPDRLIRQLTNGERPGSETYSDVCVMFTDFRNFTGLTRMLGPERAIQDLNHLFYAFDEIIASFGLERVKTIGDGYFAIAGVNTALEGAPLRTVHAAMSMQAYVAYYNRKTGGGAWSLRIGIHSGDVIAGIIGFQKIAFDVWGDAVNVASRLQNVAKENGIVVSDPFLKRVADAVVADPGGNEDLRNIGSHTIYSIVGLTEPEGFTPPDFDAIHARFTSEDDFIRRLLP